MTELTTHLHDGDLAVFLIGARVNRPWRPDGWLPAFAAMGPMLRELWKDPSSGFLHARTTVDADLRGVTTIQYWRSVEDIYRYANADDHAHRPAWLAFYRRAKKVPGAVTIWHETYAVPAGGHESLYGDAPTPFGLARATGSIPATRRGRTARERIRSTAGPAS
ncbi:DUF4188 domain-containing protein [Antribacter sp. KLBMP9083]|uniref:DUF4188 domain-containing protein n=1 Tax=Antribacter soli TaxID=2910976 RepID=A0AA41QDH0_9MICO|nr:DUF4188 domain-containing protein [Antribacter soli]MCF4121444.1 DUF4188 domain-containing protein [Antribacter soli]